MEFRILGPLEVESGGRLLALGGPKQRAVLTALLLHVNRVVSRDGLIETVWGERPPETAAAALQGYVAALRKLLGAELIVTRSPGYMLSAEPLTVDLGRFESLLRQGKEELSAGNAESASVQLTEALGLWRGEPLDDLDPGPSVAAERLRLEELRVATIEERSEADLALGRHTQLVAELQTLVREHPLRERLCGQLMLALYRSGRQAEALDAYRQARRQLSEELGLEPGEALKRLERAILEQDPTLGPVAPPEKPRPTDGRRRRLRIAWALLALIAVAGAAIGITVALTSGSGGSTVHANSVAVINPVTDKLVGDISVGKRPAAVAVGEGGVWVANQDDRTISQIDPKTRKVVDTIGVGSDVHEIASGFGSVWVAGGTDGTVTRIDPRTGKTTTFGLGPQPVFWVATGAGGVWATSGEELVRIDPTSDRIAVKYPISGEPTGLTAGRRAVWLTTENDNLLAVSPRGEIRQTSGSFQGGALAPAVGAGSVWVIVYLGHGVIQPVDPGSLALGPGTDTVPFPLDVTVGRHSVWAVNVHGTVVRINPTTAAVVATIPTAPTARSAIAVGAGEVWVAIQDPS
jgi:YVTN family beta-propeller protein